LIVQASRTKRPLPEYFQFSSEASVPSNSIE
jgi:hypothetical protein